MKSYKPTSASRRSMTSSDYSTLTKGARPYKPLIVRLKSHSGRNSQGRITVRHQGGGNKKLYRMIDFKQNRMNAKAVVETIEYDPYRTAFIALVKYADGSRAYILAPEKLKVGDEIVTAEAAPLKTGNRMQLKNIPVGQQVHNIEMAPGQWRPARPLRRRVRGSARECRRLHRPQAQLRRSSPRAVDRPRIARPGFELRMEPGELRQSRPLALDGHPPDGSRQRYEPG